MARWPAGGITVVGKRVRPGDVREVNAGHCRLCSTERGECRTTGRLAKLERFTIECTVLLPAGNRAATVRERCSGRLLTRAARPVSSSHTGKGNLLRGAERSLSPLSVWYSPYASICR